jgi:hypothetical protein
MNEEFITKAIMKFLVKQGFCIVSFDFPQSGTGILLHPDNTNDKNDGIKPDIIASKGNILTVMENKDRYWKRDFEKLHQLKESGSYAKALEQLHIAHKTSSLIVGVGIPNVESTIVKAISTKSFVDFIVSVDSNGNCCLISGSI